MADLEIYPYLSGVADVIERSRSILELHDNWDGEGGLGYAKATWESACRFLFESVLKAGQVGGSPFPTPKIQPGPEGGIDIYWIMDSCSLLIHVPPQWDGPADYYGTRTNGQEIKGQFDAAIPKPDLLMWLTE